MVVRGVARRRIRARRREVPIHLRAVTKGPTMRIPGSIPVTDSRLTIAADLGRCTLWVGWQCIRLPLLLFLLVLEPVVTLALGALALLGVLTALFWKYFGPPSLGGRVVASSQISAHRQPPTRRPRSTTSTLSLSLAARTGAPPARVAGPK